MSKKRMFLNIFSKITISVCVFCAFFISPVFAILPAGFTELEYIESTGTQWIDTGIVSYKNTYRYEFNIRKNINSTTFISFQNPDSGAENIGVFTNYSGYIIQNGSGDRVSLSADSTNFHNIVLERDGVTLDGQKRAITGSSEFTVAGKLYVFTCTTKDSRRFVGSIALFKTYDENNNLILNLIPARRNSDGEIGMYDTVSGTFFTNQGTGNFIAGPVAEIKIATTKMVDEEFAAAEAKLATTVQTIESVVSRTITQTGQIQVLQDTKQTRPDESCPANMKCLLVQDEDGTPHWYPIIEP